MGETTIEWADFTFNPWIGCTKVSQGCKNCYAENMMDKRYGRVNWGPGNPRQRTADSNWMQSFKWEREAIQSGIRRRVFCASLADVFDDEVPIRWRTDLLSVIRLTPNLDWLLLTKRPENIIPLLTKSQGDASEINFNLEFWLADWIFKGQAPDNVWLGTSVENQEAADKRVPVLLGVPAAVRFLSCEPLLGPVNLRDVTAAREEVPDYSDALTGIVYPSSGHEPFQGARIDWVIVGGESGPGSRPMHPDWVRSLRDQCEAAGVAFHFKQWGESVPDRDRAQRANLSQAFWMMPDGTTGDRQPEPDGCTWMARVGKKAAGRTLDGVTHDAFPEAVTSP